MTLCNGYVSILNSEIRQISGTEGNDKISFNCSTSLCEVKVNESSCSFHPSQLKAYGVVVDSKGGSDSISINIDPGVYLMGLNILAEKGDNHIAVSLSSPNSAGHIELGEGVNYISIDANKPTNSIISGFRNNPDNKLQIQNAPEKGFKLISDDPSINTYDLAVNDQTMVRLHSGYNKEEMSIVADAKLALNAGKGIPQEFVDAGLSFEHPPLLEESGLISSVVFD